jgi:thioredoxin-dependent peroxiredoxin
VSVDIGRSVRDFTAESTGVNFRLSGHRGETVVLYCCPKDNTRGCASEGSDFAKSRSKFHVDEVLSVECLIDSP